jgi:hypothetical protein
MWRQRRKVGERAKEIEWNNQIPISLILPIDGGERQNRRREIFPIQIKSNVISLWQ